MSSIDITRFVDVNIVKHVADSSSGLRDTVVLFSDEITSAYDHVFATQEDYDSATIPFGASHVKTDAYVKAFFDNNGSKVRIINVEAANLETSIAALDKEYIVVAYTSATLATMYTIANNRKNVKKINQKILLTSHHSIPDETTTPKASEIAVVPDLAVKYSDVLGAEMTIAAYLSKIQVYGKDSVKDYAFTKEVITPEAANDTVLGNCLSVNFNVVMSVAGVNRNFGGNLTNEDDLVNQYMLIVLHQTLTDVVLNLLATEHLRGSSAISSLYSTLSQELNKYVVNGYLATDKVWTYNDYIVTKSGKNYTIIKKGTTLPLGYKITILPMSSLTSAEISARKAPDIYVVISDSYGIRKVTIDGEVF